MGAYAAIRFSKQLGLTKALAISPLFDISNSNAEPRWKDDIPALVTLPMMSPDFISTTCKYFFIYDPKSLDNFHVIQYKKIIPPNALKEIGIPYSGHPSSHYLRQTGIISKLTTEIIREGATSFSLRYIRSLKSKADIYLFYFSKACFERQKYLVSLSLISKAIEIHENPEYLAHQAKIFERLGNLVEALTSANRAVLLKPENPHIQGYRDLIQSRLKIHNEKN